MRISRWKDQLLFAVIARTVRHIKKDPDKSFVRLLVLSRRFVKNDFYARHVGEIEHAWRDKDSWTYKLIRHVIDALAPGVAAKLVVSMLIRGGMQAGPVQEKLREELGINIPWTVLIDPTSACNIGCRGCWATEYGNRMNLTYEELDSVICQAKELGVHYFIYSGGEPMMRRNDLLTLAEKHSDCMFMAFTNGTLIDEPLAQRLSSLGNFAFALSVEGFEDATDKRRGEGTYRRVIASMDLLHKYGIAFGFSACYTSENWQEIGSEKFIDRMIEKGCLFGWLFTYIPIGTDALPELMVSPGQRAFMYHFVRRIRKEKPLFLLDFWNDGEFVDGCIAGGRRYLHINANGDVEPCAFIHYSGANVRNMPLVEALRQPLFMQYRDNQPFNENMLRPCPLLDNPDMLCKMVNAAGAVSTQPVDKEDAETLAAKTRETAEKWAPVADRLWAQSHAGTEETNGLSD